MRERQTGLVVTRRRALAGLAALGAVSAGAVAAACGAPQQRVGTAERPLVMAFVPSVDSQKVLASGRPLAELLGKQTGFTFNVEVPTAYAPVIEAMGAGKVDIGWLAPFGYTLARKKYQVEVILATVRQNSKTYRSQIITHVENGISKIDDLRGKRFAFADPQSASGFLYPASLIKEKLNADPAQFFKEVIYAGGHDKVVVAVYNKQVDGGATFGRSNPDPSAPISDARTRVQSTLPDVLQKVTIITETDPIPNDTVSVRKGLPRDVVDKVKNGLLEIARLPDGKKLLSDLYSIDGLAPATDDDYAPVRRKADLVGLNLEQVIGVAPTPTPRRTG